MTGNGVTWNYTYDAGGMRTGRTNGTTTYSYVYNGGRLSQMTVGSDTLRYRGYIYDAESGLYYLQSRNYNSEMGRFINADVAVAAGQGLTGNNMFAYCGNNPVCRTDPNEVRRDTQHWSCKSLPGT